MLAVLPDPTAASSIGWLVLALAGLCVAVNSIAGFWKEHVREKPTPSTTYATKVELDTELGRERSSRKKVHEEIAGLQGEAKTLATRADSTERDLDGVRRWLEETNQRIDEIPARTIRLLNETKQLHK